VANDLLVLVEAVVLATGHCREGGHERRTFEPFSVWRIFNDLSGEGMLFE
jgi:hypothetical protein